MLPQRPWWNSVGWNKTKAVFLHDLTRLDSLFCVYHIGGGSKQAEPLKVKTLQTAGQRELLLESSLMQRYIRHTNSILCPQDSDFWFLIFSKKQPSSVCLSMKGCQKEKPPSFRCVCIKLRNILWQFHIASLWRLAENPSSDRRVRINHSNTLIVWPQLQTQQCFD